MVLRRGKVGDDLWNEAVLEKAYGKKMHAYQEHLLEQYKICAEMVDRISSQRVRVHSFFVTINTGLLAVISYVNLEKESGTTSSLYALLGVGGLALCYLWYLLIKSYRQMSDWKDDVLYELEKKLPARPYYVQGQHIRGDGRGKRYKPFTYIEVWVPWVFLLIHAGITIYCVPWAFLWKFLSWVGHVW